MKSKLCILAVILILSLGLGLTAEPVPGKVVQLDPYQVNAVFPSIRVRFVLSRQNLFDPANDPILEARVVAVNATQDADDTDLRPHDLLVGLNGTPLPGLTLKQLATLVGQARGQENLIWQVRRGLETRDILHNGEWLTPLPGLTR